MENAFLTAVILSALVTACMRAVPIILLSRLRLPPLIHAWLGFIPAAIMAAIIVTELMARPACSASGWSISALAATIAFAVGAFVRSLFWTVFAGITAFIVLQTTLH